MRRYLFQPGQEDLLEFLLQGGLEQWLKLPVSWLQVMMNHGQKYATSVNPMDSQIRQGTAPWTGVTPPAILGYDVSGVVAAVGEGVHDFQVGDEVYYTPDPFSQGSDAEYHVVNESIVASKPSTLTHLEAASIPLVGTMAWEALITRAQLQAGETVLITAGLAGLVRLRSKSPRLGGRPS